jgi:hypothetical protein
MPSDPADFNLIIEHRLLGRFALHEEFALELQGGPDEVGTWRRISLAELKDAFVRASKHSDDLDVSQGTDESDELLDCEIEAWAGGPAGPIPRIPVENDTSHIEQADRVLSRAGIRYRTVGGIGSRGDISGHVTYLVNSLGPSKRHLCRSGFIASPESESVLVHSINGWKIRLLVGRI